MVEQGAVNAKVVGSSPTAGAILQSAVRRIMQTILYRDANWLCTCIPEDGARLSRLAYQEIDLLTGPPPAFRPPVSCGVYETRPVYGYDDCFPSVTAGHHPTRDIPVPDHGSCWRMFAPTVLLPDGLESTFSLPLYDARLCRKLVFMPDGIRWQFRIDNLGTDVLPCQHVMHPLMPPARIHALRLPRFGECFDIIGQVRLGLPEPADVANLLLETPHGTAQLLMLRQLKDHSLTIQFHEGLTVCIEFPPHLFQTLGIWWDRAGYPTEPDLQREECAFEPIAGPRSALEDAYASGQAFMVPAGGRMEWRIAWRISAPDRRRATNRGGVPSHAPA